MNGKRTNTHRTIRNAYNDFRWSHTLPIAEVGTNKGRNTALLTKPTMGTYHTTPKAPYPIGLSG